jgi:hypothetical protein
MAGQGGVDGLARNSMPTLIRLLLVLIVLAGLGFAGMIALTVMVDPGEKDITIKIPARELMPTVSDDPLGIDELPAPVNVAPKESSEEPPETSRAPTDASGVETVEPGAPE